MVFKGMGREVSDTKIARVFRKIDTDGSGQIEYGKFLAWWRKQSRRRGAFLGCCASGPQQVIGS